MQVMGEVAGKSVLVGKAEQSVQRDMKRKGMYPSRNERAFLV